jgi:hypothetical protein
MGIWGADIYDNDAAVATKAIFEVALVDGKSVAEATLQVFDELKVMAEDEGVLPVMIVALAALQIEKKALQPEVRDMTIDIIKNGRGLNYWEELGPVNLALRKTALEKLFSTIS